MKSKLLLVMLILIMGSISACGAKSESMAPASVEYDRVLMESGAVAMAPAEMPAAPEAYQSADGSLMADNTNAAGVKRIVLKNANLSIVVPDPAASLDRIVKMAEQMGGFVVNSSLSKYTTDQGIEVPVANIVIRVPADKLTVALDAIKGQTEDPDSDVLSEQVSGQDVTSEYTDLQSRLTNLELAEKQLQQILATTTKTEDWLKVFNQLTATREQIEVLKGQIKYYDESSTFSSISINLQAPEAVKPVTIGKWEPKGDVLKAVQALVNGLKIIYRIFVYLVLLVLPILVVTVGPVWLVVWLVRRAVKRRKAATPPPAGKK